MTVYSGVSSTAGVRNKQNYILLTPLELNTPAVLTAYHAINKLFTLYSLRHPLMNSEHHTFNSIICWVYLNLHKT